MPITDLPTPPTRSDPASFAARADAFMAALPDFVTEANSLADELATAAYEGASSTSTTSLTIGSGEKILTVETGKFFIPGMKLLVADTSAPETNWMHGSVTNYVTGTGVLTVNVSLVEGSGTIAAWTISLSAPSVQSDVNATPSTIPVRDTNGDLSGDILGNAATADSAKTAGTATKHGTLNTTTLEIGPWSMDIDDYITVAHGIADFTKIRRIEVMIISDNETELHPLTGDRQLTGTSNGVHQINSANVVLGRASSGFFDSAGYASAVLPNRGWVTIDYVD